MLNIICCGMIMKEAEFILKEIGFQDKVALLDPGVHEFEYLEKGLTEQLEKKKEENNNPTVVIIGQDCHPNMNSILSQYSAVGLNAANCFEALLGEEKERLDKESNTCYMTYGYFEWLQRIGWTEVDVRNSLGFFERVLLLDTGLVEITDEKILELFDYIQVPIEVKRVNLEGLKNLIIEAVDKAKSELS